MPPRLHPRLQPRFFTLALTAFVVCFAVGAARPTPTSARPVHATRPAPRAVLDSIGVNAVVYNGWKMFEVYCTRCHGEDAVGSSFAPALKHSVGPDGTIDHKAFWLTVTFGRPGKGMPTWGNLLSPEQKEDIWNYLRARAVGGLLPGRPHIAAGAKKDSTAFPPAQGNDTTFMPPFLSAAS
jgi:mono/diheme cytochrome c family protein